MTNLILSQQNKWFVIDVLIIEDLKTGEQSVYLAKNKP